jgi:hypothetical protein
MRWLVAMGLSLGAVGCGGDATDDGAAAGAADEKDTQALAERIVRANLVVEGSVASITDVADTGPISEHRPDFRDATITLTDVLDGPADLDQSAPLTVRFDASGDKANLKHPKLSVGEQALLILRPAPAAAGTFLVIDPRDVADPSARAIVAAALERARLWRRMVTADRIVRGRVTSVSDLPDTGPISRHEPDFRLATVAVLESFAGDVGGDNTLNVKFDASIDTVHVREPKLREGDERMLLLHADPTAGLPTFLAVDPIDVQGADAQAAIVAELPTVKLLREIANADRIVEGVVESVRKLPGGGQISRHSGELAVASLRVDFALAGSDAASVEVVFDQSIDVAHFQEPKLSVDQRAIFLLQPDGMGGFTMFDPNDLQDENAAARLEGIL